MLAGGWAHGIPANGWDVGATLLAPPAHGWALGAGA